MSAVSASAAASAAEARTAELDVDSMPALPIWGKFVADLSWLEHAGEQQKAIETHIASEDLDKLLEKHPSGPDFFQPFLIAEVGNSAAQLLEVEEKALAGHARVSEISETASSQLKDLAAQAGAEDQARRKDDLAKLRDDKLGDIMTHTKALGEVADPDEIKSQHEVLAAKHGEEALAQMGKEGRDAAYEELVAERILSHETTAYASVQALLQASDPPSKLAEILAKAGELGAGQPQVDSATAAWQEARDLLEAAKQSLVAQERTLVACEAQKRARLQEGSSRRAALEAALRGLQQADRDFRCWHVEHEAHRLQVQRLRAGVARAKEEVAAVESVWPEADAACRGWLDLAAAEAEAVRAQETEAARAAVEHAQDAIAAAALNALVGRELCRKILGDKDAETASLEHERGALEGEMALLKAQLKEPFKNVRAKRTQLAYQKDRQSKLDAQLASCKQRHVEVEQTLADAQRRFDALKALSSYGLSIQEEGLTQTAQRLSQEAYGHFQCFAGAQEPEEPERSPSGSGALATLSPSITALFKQMLEEQKHSLLLQLKADLEVRRGGVNGSGRAAHSSGGSDAGDSTFNLVQELGAVEHFIIASDVGSAVGSSSCAGGEAEAQPPMQGTNGGGGRADSDAVGVRKA